MSSPSSVAHRRLLAELIRPHAGALSALAALLLVASLLPLAGPQLLRAFIDAAAGGAELGWLLAVAGAYVVLGLAAQGATIAMTWWATHLAWTATNELRERTAAHVLHLDLGFHGQTTPGTLVERIDGDADAITKLFTDVVVRIAGGAITLLGAVVLVAITDWRLGLAFALFAGGAIAVAVRVREQAVPATTAERAAFAEVIGVVEETLDAGEDLRAHGAGGFAVARHERASGAHVDAMTRAWRVAGMLWTTITGTFAAGGVAMLAAGAVLHRRDAITIGTVFLLFQYVQVLRRPIETIAEQLQEVQRAGAGAARIADLLATPSRVEHGGAAVLPAGALELHIDGVSFAYPDDDAPVLHDVDLVVEAGSVLGLVGRSGGGKTTLARLALRLVDPTVGAVRLDGVDLRDVEPDDLRHRVAMVTQDVQLFTASLRDNLTLFGSTGGACADDELIALLHELGLGGWFAALPAGLDTELGGDVGLSAGQAQLVGVARAFLRDPGLVVLDEASSRVDPDTAELVEAALDRLLAGRTAVVIAHRLRAVDRADTVAVIEGGRVVEHGRRDDLATRTGSRFQQLLALETQGAAL